MSGLADGHAILSGLLATAGLPPGAAALARLTGDEPALPSSFRVGVAAQAAIAAAGLGAALLWQHRTGRRQPVTVEMRATAAEFRSERHFHCLDAPIPDPWDAIAGLYRCGDGGWVRLHTNFPHHRDGVLRLLGCGPTRAEVAEALAGRRAGAFEDEASAAGLCVAMLRDVATWDAHPHGRHLAAAPPLTLTRLGDAPPRHFPPAPARPLAGLRVLDLTRVIAGPVGGRTLAAHGAEVLHITAPHLPAIPLLVMDGGRGKLSASLDLRGEADRARLRALVRDSDVFLQSYRQGALAGQGFSPEALAALRPGIVVATLSAYGETGPWGGRRGYDSLVQTATGFNAAEAEAAGAGAPKPLPCQALDHASGYFLALGVMAALLRQAHEGGSWLVRVSLAGTGLWLRRLGRLPQGLAAPDPGDDVADLLEETDSGFGRI
ncbi:CoA transferase, partial [Rhodovastum atsumiense]